MTFLIDECLHTSLVDVARVAGHAAFHVVHLGIQGSKDYELFEDAQIVVKRYQLPKD